MLINVALLLFKLEDKKELHEEVTPEWSAIRGFKWQYSKSYIIPQTTNLFCHKILFFEFNILTSFSPHFFANIEGAYTPTWFSSGARGYSVFPHKVWRDLFLKDLPLRKICWGSVLHGGLMIRSCQERGSFTNAFSNNLETVNLKIFANH